LPNLNTLEYHILSDGVAWTDGGGAFGLVPRLIWEKRFPPNSQNRIPFSVNCLLIHSQGKNILVDTGYGQKLTDRMQSHAGLERPHGDLLAHLARHNLKPEDINIVINTHLHLDHCGGNTRLEGNTPVAAFPNAVYFVQRLEYADAIVPNERTRATYFPQNYAPLLQTGQLHLLNGDTQITGHVRVAVTRGHTRAHQVVVLESAGAAALFTGDMATLHYHLERLAWVTAYDVEPLESIETKRTWQKWAAHREALLIFQHDAQITTGRLKPDGENYIVEPVSVD
jgi:glyoxylase-like metal-dependent hydrolase (beta-lactamase superfamily II)